jgi:hypothetical protein
MIVNLKKKKITTNLEKDLGVYLPSNLKWDNHIKKLGLIKHSFKCLDKRNMKLIYTYGSQMWSYSMETNIFKKRLI